MTGRRRLRVLWVMKELAIGGAERLLVEIQRHADEVHFLPVALRAGDRSLVPLLRAQALEPLILNSSHELDLRWAWRLRKAVRDLRPDVVHLNNPYPAAGGRVGLVGAKVPLVYTEHNVWPRYHPLSRWANAMTLSMTDRIIAVSDAVRDSMLRSRLGRRLGVKITVIPNGIDVRGVQQDAVRPTGDINSSTPTYGAVGHLRFSKGIDVLLHAARELQDLLPGARGIVVGEGEDRAMLETKRRELGAHSVTFLGVRQDARAIMGELDVFVIASRVEGLPLALLEAMSLSKPIVATTAGGITNVLTDGHDALLVPSGDPSRLAQAISYLLDNPDMAGQLGRNALGTVEERFGVRDTARRYEAIYRELCE